MVFIFYSRSCPTRMEVKTKPEGEDEEDRLVSELKRRLEDEDLTPEEKLRLLTDSLNSETLTSCCSHSKSCSFHNKSTSECVFSGVSCGRRSELGGRPREQRWADPPEVPAVPERRAGSLCPRSASQQAAGQPERWGHSRPPDQVTSEDTFTLRVYLKVDGDATPVCVSAAPAVWGRSLAAAPRPFISSSCPRSWTPCCHWLLSWWPELMWGAAV